MTLTIENRAQRIAALGYDYRAQPRQAVTACNLCGDTAFVVVTHRDRYGYPAEAHACETCGLVFINPRMTADAYGRFYEGVYRPLVSAYHGRPIDADTIQDEQRVYGAACADFLRPFVAGAGLRTMLDIGGSTGVVARVLADEFALQGTVIDPAPPELARAKAYGLETITGLVEEYEFGDRRFDLIVLCQTVDHLLDVSGTLTRIRELLSDGGYFFVDIVDLRAAYLRNWSVEEAIKIDHPYYLTEPVMRAYLERAGLAVLRTDYAADHLHVGYVCRAGEPRREARPSDASVRELFRELRTVQNAPRPR
jgi:2-polyprenyl-3-methyl-5-hydroxy-6-metoxy-1,4-benzoquinol methylase